MSFNDGTVYITRRDAITDAMNLRHLPLQRLVECIIGFSHGDHYDRVGLDYSLNLCEDVTDAHTARRQDFDGRVLR